MGKQRKTASDQAEKLGAGCRDPAGRFRPGVSGNPGGRPRNAPSLTALIVERLTVSGDDGRTAAERLADAVVADALGGNLRAVVEIWTRLDGPAGKSVPAAAVVESVKERRQSTRGLRDADAETMRQLEEALENGGNSYGDS